MAPLSFFSRFSSFPRPLPLLVILSLLASLLFASFAHAQEQQSQIPIGLQKIQEENRRFADEFSKNVTILIAFLAGITTILSPCLLPVLPAYFSYAFKERRNLTLMTLLFFVGFSSAFIALGIGASVAGSFLASFVENISFFVMVSGGILILLGIYIIFGGSFDLGFTSGPKAIRKTPLGILLTGVLFGLGWVLCVGPILSGVLIAASVFHDYSTTIMLMLAYSLGVFVPLFALSFFYDTWKLGEKKWMQGVEFNWGGMRINSFNLLSGSLLVLTGIIFIFFKGTGAINGFTYFGLKNHFYSLQDFFLTNSLLANSIGGVLLLALLGAMAYVLLRKGK